MDFDVLGRRMAVVNSTLSVSASGVKSGGSASANIRTVILHVPGLRMAGLGVRGFTAALGASFGHCAGGRLLVFKAVTDRAENLLHRNKRLLGAALRFCYPDIFDRTRERALQGRLGWPKWRLVARGP